MDGNEKAGAWNYSYVKINANHAQGPFTLTADLGGIGTEWSVALGSVSNPMGHRRAGQCFIQCFTGRPDMERAGYCNLCAGGDKPGSGPTASRRSSMCSSWMPPKRHVISVWSSAHGLDASKDPAAPYTWLGVDEFTVNGAPPLASGRGHRIYGYP